MNEEVTQAEVGDPPHPAEEDVGQPSVQSLLVVEQIPGMDVPPEISSASAGLIGLRGINPDE